MKNYNKYRPGYYMPPGTLPGLDAEGAPHPAPPMVQRRPAGRQPGPSSPPMNLEEKLEFYRLLLEVGFKEIEVGFPAASETEYEFLRTIIEDHLIPEDVSIQVLTQSRPHIIKKDLRCHQGRQKRGGPPVQLHLLRPAAAGLPDERGRDRGHRRVRGQAL